MMSLPTCLFSAALLLGLATPGPADEFRRWSDITGRFGVEARLLRIEGSLVFLERADGVTVVIERDRLSPQDQAYLEEIVRTNPFKVLEERPEKTSPGATVTPPPKRRETSCQDPPVADEGAHFVPYFLRENSAPVINWLQVRSVSVNPNVGWRLTVPKWEPLPPRVKTLGLPPKSDLFERVSALVVNPVAKRAVIQYTLRRPGSRGKAGKIIVCDLEGGVVGVVPELPADEVPLAIYPAALPHNRLCLFRRDEFGFGNQDRLTYYFVTPGGGGIIGELKPVIGLVPQFSWSPYERETGAARDIKWADFPDERTLVTCSGNGLILVWNLERMQPEAAVQTTLGQIPALSPTRQWLAFATKDQIGILDIKKREVLAVQNTPQPQSFPVLAFSPSGQKLACLTNQRNIRVWDVGSGRLEAEFTLPSGMAFQENFIFPHDDFLLGNNRYLVHWKSQILVWEYDNLEATAALGNLTCAVTGRRQGTGSVMGLVVAHIPHAAAQQVLEAALNNPETFAFRRGVPVEIDVSAIPEDARDKVSEILVRRLKEMGCDPREHARVTVAAGVSGPKERTVSYYHSGDYKVKEYQLWIKILADGQVLWETSAGGVPFVLLLRPGENVGQKLEELTAKPNYDWFNTVTLPLYLQGTPIKGSIALGRGPLIIEP